MPMLPSAVLKRKQCVELSAGLIVEGSLTGAGRDLTGEPGVECRFCVTRMNNIFAYVFHRRTRV
jgi:hypothetical protein